MASGGAAFTEGSVFKHISGLAATSAIGLFAIFIVDLVDVFFIALLGEPELAAAVGFAGIGLFFGASICIGLAISISTLVAQNIGAAASADASDSDAEREIASTAANSNVASLASNGLLYTLLWTIPLTIITLVFAPELIGLLGAEGETLDLAVGYFRIVGVSLPVLGFAMAGTSMLRALGEGKLSMWSTIIGGLVNAVFDPLFIFGLNLDLTGAAIASVLSRITVAGVALYYIASKHALIRTPDWSRFASDVRSLNGIALPSIITNLSGPLGSAYATGKMAQYGTDAVAAASVIGRLTPVAFAGLYGLSGAVGPVASQNMGANEFTRVRKTLIASGQFVTLYVIPVAIIMFALKDVLVGIFELDGEAADLLRFYCTFIVISYWLFGLQLSANPLFTAMRHPGFATISNIARDICLSIPLIALGSAVLGAPGVLAGQAAGNAIAGVAAFTVALWLARRMEDGKTINLPSLGTRWHFHRQVVPGIQQRGH